ncbi:MAG: DUF4982 domain-containing protein [Proteobacteria bacterium]|nr:DUF4982 domain-containing protein [Pseudomonadota bacterium]
MHLTMRVLRRAVSVFSVICMSAVGAAAAPASEPQGGSLRTSQLLGDGWHFSKGNPRGAHEGAFDDQGWQLVHVPHDWAISEPFNPNNDSNTRFDWRGEGWYRHALDLPAAAAGHQVFLDFDGVMAFAQVYVNGQLAGGWDYGYNSFRIDATPFVNFGAANVVAVHADTREHWSRWYAGAGIYRKVVLTLTAPVHVAHWGTYVTTPHISANNAQVQIQTTIDNDSNTPQAVTVSTSIVAPGEAATPRLVANEVLSVPAHASRPLTQHIDVKDPQLWGPKSPSLYTAISTLSIGGKVVDTYQTKFGIRSLEFTVDDGLHVNGERLQIHGVDLHHDHGPLGSAFHVRAMERQLQIMKDMGVNAIRTSHNPPAPELLDLADQMGLLVFAECFDKWDQTADRMPYVDLASFGRRNIGQFIRRDRNHPSIMIWSIGNEIWDIEGSQDKSAAESVRMMAGFVREFDATRPVTMANHMPQSIGTGLHRYLDVISWNYGEKYVAGRAAYPNKPTWMSESSSGVSTRGFYQLTLPAYKEEFPAKPTLDSSDLNAVSWGDIADVEFTRIGAHRYVAGEFVWSGFDYIGEPTPYEQVARSSYFGIVDLVGLAKDRYYLYRSYWAPEAATVHILPHWTWPEEQKGRPLPVFVYTNGDSAELFLNGRSLGMRSKVVTESLPANLAINTAATASSEQGQSGHAAKGAVDGSGATRWCASDDRAGAWLQLDLGGVKELKTIYVDFEKSIDNYQYTIKGSVDGKQWTVLSAKRDFSGAGTGLTVMVDASSRYLRLEFDQLKMGAWASVAEFEAYGAQIDRSYYGATRTYRLRWDNVPYAPGELTAVAYKEGAKLGSETIHTAGAPVALSLAADRSEFASGGDDLSYLTLSAVDAQGHPHPEADHLIHLSVAGAGELAGVGNGDPASTDAFQSSDVRLFHGKAIVIIKGKSGPGGAIQVTATAPGLAPVTLELTAVDAKKAF